MIRILVIAGLLISSTASYACLNLFGVDSSGKAQLLEHTFFPSIEFRHKQIEANLKQLQKKFDRNDYSYQDVSDYGAFLLMSGQFQHGLDIFRALSIKYPAVYQVMANTAVAFELNGNIDSALICQQAAMKLNPGAHNKSEWIHLKILQARKKMLIDPDWCEKNNVTGAADSIKKYARGNHPLLGEPLGIYAQFVDQLSERLPFTYAEDKVMGKLMFELGDAYQYGSLHRAYYCYALAKYLDAGLTAAAESKMAAIRKTYAGRPRKLKPEEMNSRKEWQREMRLPGEAEVNEFINRMVNRPSLKSRTVKTVSIDHLLSKI